MRLAQELVRFVHRIRREISRSEGETGTSSSQQWQCNRSHYIHRFLHPSLLVHINLVSEDHFDRVSKAQATTARDKPLQRSDDNTSQWMSKPFYSANAADATKPRLMWSKDVIASFNRLIQKCRFR